MKELNDIILAYDNALLQNKQTALATVVRVDGSSYRRPGARMLVTEDGEITGAISGGCLEGDALRKAQFAILKQENKIEIYDTTDDENDRLGIQLGCNGVVYILFEPIKKEDENNPIHLLKKIIQSRKDSALATVFNVKIGAPQLGTCGFINEQESFFRGEDFQALKTECHNILENKSSAVKHYEGNNTVLLQFIPPAIQLIIAGAGNDAQPLVEMAFLLGWNIIVADGRPSYAIQKRFSKANQVIVIKPDNILSVANIDEQTAVVLMTHNYNYDITVLEHLISTRCGYIGLLGPKKKLHKMFCELAGKGIQINDKVMHNIYSPVGLDIGAETSEEIALSVLAEIKAVFSNRQGSSLKGRTTEIHDRSSISHYE